MNYENLPDEYKKIMDTIDTCLSLEDECLKFFCLMHCMMRSWQHNGQDLIGRPYLIEKTARLVGRQAIVLDSKGKMMFCNIKLKQRKENENV